MKSSRFENQTLAFVGGAGGVGKACVLRALDEGARVAILDLNVPDDLIPADHPAHDQGRIFQQRLDITDQEQVAQVMGEVQEWAGRLDGLAITAAKISGADALSSQLNDWNSQHAVNNTGPFLCIQAVLPHFLKEGNGTIVTVSSVSAAVAGIGTDIAYKSSKAALVQMTRTIAVDYAAQGVRANCVLPGAIATAFGRSGRVASASELGTGSGKKPPLGRRALPEEIASAILYLLSNDSSYITGVALPVDGGFLAI